jgi:hypothetical protein
MTDLEINKALALAIGWSESAFRIRYHKLLLQQSENHFARPFSYTDWNVIAPIAERYGMFPAGKANNYWYVPVWGAQILYADSPQKAIAMAVIAGAKKGPTT